MCVDLNAQDSLLDPIASRMKRWDVLAETILDVDGAFVNTAPPIHQHPSASGVYTPNVAIALESLQQLCKWFPSESQSFVHRPIPNNLCLPAEQQMEQEWLTWIR